MTHITKKSGLNFSFETNIQLRRSIWRSFVKEKLANQKERQLAAKVVNTMKKYFGMVTGSGDVLVETRVLKLFLR